MNDLQTVNNIIDTAVKDSSYTTVIISCGVFIIYTLINKVIELYKAKDRNKPMLDMASAIKQVSENVVKLNQVLDKTFQDAEIKEANRITNIIVASFNSFFTQYGSVIKGYDAYNIIGKINEVNANQDSDYFIHFDNNITREKDFYYTENFLKDFSYHYHCYINGF